jgi:hypothetical protein
MADEKVEKIYEEFWKPLVEKDGVLDIEQVKKELHDFYIMIQEVPKVYCEVTNGMVSKPLTSADIVIMYFNDTVQDRIDEYVHDFLTS